MNGQATVVEEEGKKNVYLKGKLGGAGDAGRTKRGLVRFVQSGKCLPHKHEDPSSPREIRPLWGASVAPVLEKQRLSQSLQA